MSIFLTLLLQRRRLTTGYTILNTTNTDLLIFYDVYQKMYIYTYILKYYIIFQTLPYFFGASAPSLGIFDIVFAKVTNIKIIKTL